MDLGPADGSNIPPRDRLQDKRRRGGLASISAASLLQFHATAPTTCPYVPGRAERKLVVELERASAAFVYGDLSRAGFRRNHSRKSGAPGSV